MTQQFARVPVDAGAVVREVRGFGGVPWARLFRYLRPNIGRFSIALVGLVISSLIGLAFPLVIAGITTEVVAGGDAAGLDRLVVILLVLFCIQAVGSFLQTYLLGVVGERVVAQLRGDLFGRLVTLSLDFHARTPRRRARVAAVERRDARADDADPDRHEPAVGGHRAGRLDHHPVHPQPHAAVHRAVARARPDRGRHRVRQAAPAGQHPGPGHHRAEHDDGRGGAVRDPRGQELRPRGLGARALRRGPPDGRRDRLAAGAVAGDVRRADGVARLRRARRGCSGTPATRSSTASSGSAR